MEPCPNCGSTIWKLDCDIVQRVAIVGDGDEVRTVFIDRCGPVDGHIFNSGEVSCHSCGFTWEPAGTRDPSAVIGNLDDIPSEKFVVMTDYREF